MDITIVLTKVMKQIVRQLPVPTTSFSALTVAPIERQNVLQNLNFATENETVKMELTKNRRVRPLLVPLWDVNINVAHR